jgi:hypothetical protein
MCCRTLPTIQEIEPLPFVFTLQTPCTDGEVAPFRTWRLEYKHTNVSNPLKRLCQSDISQKYSSVGRHLERQQAIRLLLTTI